MIKNTDDPKKFLELEYDKAMVFLGSSETIKIDLTDSERILLNIVLKYSERAKAVLTVIITSIVYKQLHPKQDIRNHQSSIPGGYSGRTFDSQFITPFMKAKKFPSMSESGWLTRSLEQKVPYDENYSGAINPAELKTAFLSIIKNIQNGSDADKYLSYLMQGLILQRNKHQIELSKPTTLPISIILELLESHFNYKYQAEGASRLPVIAIYAAYQTLIKEVKRFNEKELLPLESHTSSDKRSGRIGDIEISDKRQRPFEAVEVKHGIQITLQIVKDSYEKFNKTPVERYYILSTSPSTENELKLINTEILRIKNTHGCQLIVNGIMDTIKYYLRLLSNTYEFIENYVNLLYKDKSLKFEHKERWNKIIGDLHQNSN